MAKITPNSLISSISGAVCKHDGVYFATNKQTGKVYAVQVCNPSEQEPTAKQLAARESFKNRMKAASAWLKANPKGSDAYKEVEAAYKAQHKIGNITAYIAKYVVNASSTPEGGTTPDPDAPIHL